MDGARPEGSTPEIGPGLTLADVVERAFDYRGDVTVVRRDGQQVEGYLFNRDPAAAVPFVQLFERDRDEPRTIPYAEIRTIRFTGRDTAAGNTYAAWLQRREAERSGSAPRA